MAADFRIAVLGGDGIGPEVTDVAVAIARAALADAGVTVDFVPALIGGAAIDTVGTALPEATLALCADADAVFLGAVGGPRWDDPAATVRPEQGLLGLRRELGVFANLRPVKPHPVLMDASPLRTERLHDVDLMFVRELTGGLYFGASARDDQRAHDTCVYTASEIERVVRRAARIAQGRRGHLTSVDKANVLETSRLWRDVTERVVRSEFPDVVLEHLLVDAMAMHLLSRPRDFDVIVTENMFGDILTDEASMLTGALGLLPSASLGAETRGLYEPVHGSAPDIVGTGTANPVGAVLSMALALRHSLGLDAAATRIEDAVGAALREGIRTRDLGGSATTAEAKSAIAAALAPARST